MFSENEFSFECSEVWMKKFYQVTWQCDFQLMKFPFETVICNMSFELQSRQLWDEDKLRIFIPIFSHLPYNVSPTNLKFILLRDRVKGFLLVSIE